jgi:hypothetical protein
MNQLNHCFIYFIAFIIIDEAYSLDQKYPIPTPQPHLIATESKSESSATAAGEVGEDDPAWVGQLVPLA